MNSTNSTNSSRPITVWIAQVVLVLFGTLWGLAGLINIFLVIGGPENLEMPFWPSVVTVALEILLAASLLAGFYGLIKRKSYGRWIAVASLALACVAGVLNSFAGFTRYRNPNEALGAMAFGFILYGLLGYLVYRLVRGEREKEFFSGTHHRVTENTEEELEQDG